MSAARKMRTARWRAYLSEWLSDAELAHRIREAFTVGYTPDDVAEMVGTTRTVIDRLAGVQS